MTDDEKRVHANGVSDPQRPPKSGKTGFETLRYEENTVIFEEGEPGDAAYLIVRGQVEIRKGTRSSNPQTLAMLSKNDIFGEMALFDDSPRMAEAIAHTRVEVITIGREEFNRRLETVDPVIRTISVYLVGRVRHMANEFMKRKDPNWASWKKE